MLTAHTEEVENTTEDDLPRDPRLRNRKPPVPVSPLPPSQPPQQQAVLQPPQQCPQYPYPSPQFPGVFGPGQSTAPPPYFFYPPVFNQAYPFPPMDVPPPAMPSSFSQPPPNFVWPRQTDDNDQKPIRRPQTERSRRSESCSSRQSEDSRSSRDRRRRSRTPERSRRDRSRDRSRRYRDRSRERSSRSHGRYRSTRPTGTNTKRDALIEKWRRLNCTSENELERKLLRLSKMNSDQLLREEANYWIRSAPATTFYEQDKLLPGLITGTSRVLSLCDEFNTRLILNAKNIRAEKSSQLPSSVKRRPVRKCPHHHAHNSCSSSDEEIGNEESEIMEELNRKIQHPFRLHRELWHNEPGEMNDGPLCKCSVKAKRSGIRHGFYAGEAPPGVFTDQNIGIGVCKREPDALGSQCDPDTNNAGRLYHYRITISPPTNFLSKTPTIITHDGHEFIFSGFSLLSHYPIPKLPVCKVIRFNIEYTILYVEETFPECFTVRECDLFFEYLFREILELFDLDLYATAEKCPVFHFMPRFIRDLPEEGHELLPMCLVLKYLLASYRPLVPEDILADIPETPTRLWADYVESVKWMIVTKPGMKPSSIRVDQLDKEVEDDKKSDSSTKKPEKPSYPEIIHFGIRPPQLSYAGNQEYQKAWREYVKHRHLVYNLAKPSMEEKMKLTGKETELQKIRTRSTMKRDATAVVSSEGFLRTGLMCDIVQHAMLIPVLACHLRFHRSLDELEKKVNYVFKNRNLLQLALTHPSYRENFGTNPDHARNSLTNCGIRQPEYGDRRIHYKSTQKRGISTLMNIMSRFGSTGEKESNIYHNERLEFLGDAVVEFVTTIHLFHIFRDLEEGGLATYRAALVQNQHLAVLAKGLSLDEFLLYAHGSDLCHDLELNHALANCFEALMGALFLDGGIKIPDRVFGETVYSHNQQLLDVWQKYPPHVIQQQEPNGDRHWIEKMDFLKKLTEFETTTGIQFRHIRLLARAFTDRSVGYTNLTLGSNQRLEFLGDSVLQLVASEYLYKHFPDHHEGHLSLLRSSLVNNNTQSVVCDDLGMTPYARYAPTKGELKIKDKADLLEAFLGALYVDKGDLLWIEKFCNVCFFPRLQTFIMNQEWNDPKSKLQQCCLTLRTMDGGEPDIPCYKVVESKGPTNTRTYSVAAYFRGKRLATGTGHSIQQAEMKAAQAALKECFELFPQLDKGKQTRKPSDKKEDKPKQRSQRSRTPEQYKLERRQRSTSSSDSSKGSHSGSPEPRRKSKRRSSSSSSS